MFVNGRLDARLGKMLSSAVIDLRLEERAGSDESICLVDALDLEVVDDDLAK
jgi:hypothetical protein